MVGEKETFRVTAAAAGAGFEVLSRGAEEAMLEE